jgi:hypothetical protein
MGTLRVQIAPTQPGDITVRVYTAQSPPTPTPINEFFTVNVDHPLDKTWTLDPGLYATSMSWTPINNIVSGVNGMIAIDGVRKFFRATGQNVLAIFDCRINFSGLIKDGSVVSFQCLGNEYYPDHVWLDGRTRDGSVGLAPNTHDFSGTIWKARTAIDGSGIFTFECLGTNPNPKYVFLYGGATDGSVTLVPGTFFKSPAVQWKVVETYSEAEGYRCNLRCMGTSDPSFLYLDGKTKDGSVHLAPNTDPPYSGTFWKLLL